MSDMEVFYGVFRKSDLDIAEEEDTDEFAEVEEQHGCYFVKVRGQLYEFRHLPDDVHASGFSLVIEPSEETRFIALWYNGGAEIHEVVKNLIERHLRKQESNPS